MDVAESAAYGPVDGINDARSTTKATDVQLHATKSRLYVWHDEKLKLSK